MRFASFTKKQLYNRPSPISHLASRKGARLLAMPMLERTTYAVEDPSGIYDAEDAITIFATLACRSRRETDDPFRGPPVKEDHGPQGPQF